MSKMDQSASPAVLITSERSWKPLTLETAAADERKVGLQLEILKHTPMAGVEERRMLDSLRGDAAAFFSSTVPKAQTLSRQSDIVIPSTSENEDSTSLQSSPSFVIRGPNNSSFQHFPEDEEHISSETDTGSHLTK